MKNCKKIKAIYIVIAILLVICLLWVVLRLTASVECTQWSDNSDSIYEEKQKVMNAVALSYLVYGCEGCDELSGSVADILDNQRMGIIIENADISRTDASAPGTAMINSADFIRQYVGDYRIISDLKDEANSFYGAAFADDENKVVWITYAGSVSMKDTWQCILLACGARLSGQEKRAFELYETVLGTDEIKNGYQLMLTGHSLGGALSTMVSRMSGAEAITISGADGLAMRKINGICGSTDSKYSITNYLTSPDGFGYSFKDCIQRMMFWGNYKGIVCHTFEGNGMVDNSHCPFGFVVIEDGNPSTACLTNELTD